MKLPKVDRRDVPERFAYGSDPDVSRFVGWDTYQSIADAESYIDRMTGQYERGGRAN